MALPNNWAYGIDISRYDQTFDRSLSKRVIDFIIQRVSWADGWGVNEDQLLDNLWPNVSEVSRRLAYHYWSGHQSVDKQFDVFMGAISDKDYHGYAVDFETRVNPQTDESAIQCRQLVERIALATGKRVLLYQQRWEWFKYKQHWQGLDLWPKYWPFATSLGSFDADATVALYWGEQVHYVLQYGGDAWGTAGYGVAQDWGVGHGTNRKHVDLNVFNGTPQALDVWLNKEVEDPPADDVPARLDELSRVEAYIAQRRNELQ